MRSRNRDPDYFVVYVIVSKFADDREIVSQVYYTIPTLHS